MRKSQAAPMDSRTVLSRRGIICGSTTRYTTPNCEAPRVRALTVISVGILRTDRKMSRVIRGKVPTKIRTTLRDFADP